MPKIISDIKVNILKETKAQILENGYSKVTIRSIANKLNLAVGTIYNYFPSKDMIVATFMLEDWNVVLEKIQNDIFEVKDKIKVIYDGLLEFIVSYDYIFCDSSAEQNYAIMSKKYHNIFRNQIVELIVKNNITSNFVATFLAQNLITWALEKTPYSNLEPIFKKIIKGD